MISWRCLEFLRFMLPELLQLTDDRWIQPYTALMAVYDVTGKKVRHASAPCWRIPAGTHVWVPVGVFMG